jgi:hypothetical protein
MLKLPPTPQAIRIIDDYGIEHIPYDPGHNPKQLAYHASEAVNLLYWGGRGSGKSICGRWDAHLRALAHPGFTYVILRRTFPELQRSHLAHIESEMKLLKGHFNKSEKIAYYPNGSKGYFSQCDGDEDVLKLLSAEFALAFFDELSTFDWEHFLKLSASVRTTDPNLRAIVRAATNPLGPSAENIMRYFVTKDVDLETNPDYNPNDWESIHSNLEDNPFLPKEEYLKRFSALPAHIRKAWVDGEFAIENALFDFEPTRKGQPYHVIPSMSRDELMRIVENSTIYRAIDVGWFPDPTICLWIAHLGNRYIVIKDKTWYKTVATEVAADIKEIDSELLRYGIGPATPQGKVQRVAITYCDPSMDVNTVADVRTVKDIFEDSGIPMECSINKRDHFASAVHKALNEEAGPGVPRIQFVNGKPEALIGCPYLIKTIPTQRYDVKKPLFLANSKDDHGVVALAYFLISNSSMETKSYTTKKPKPWMKPKGQPERWIIGQEAVKDYQG